MSNLSNSSSRMNCSQPEDKAVATKTRSSFCRTGLLHYHRQEFDREMTCDECKEKVAVGFLRCKDSRPLCDHCYFSVGEAEEELQSVLQVWVAMRNRQERKVWD